MIFDHYVCYRDYDYHDCHDYLIDYDFVSGCGSGYCAAPHPSRIHVPSDWCENLDSRHVLVDNGHLGCFQSVGGNHRASADAVDLSFPIWNANDLSMIFAEKQIVCHSFESVVWIWNDGYSYGYGSCYSYDCYANDCVNASAVDMVVRAAFGR